MTQHELELLRGEVGDRRNDVLELSALELIERAVLQARQEADLLYLLVIKANVEVPESRTRREREYVLLVGCLGAQIRATL